jgi:Ca-activated chloride channel family protein
VAKVFERQLDTMVSELAHDLELTLRPARGYRIAGVFGVPDDVMTESPEGAIILRVPTVFLSTNGGGIFVSIASASSRANLPAARLAADKPLLTVAARWNEAQGGRTGSHRLAVLPATGTPGTAMRTAHLLVDEYLSMREATLAFHRRADPKAAFATLNGLSTRIKSSGLPGMDKEDKLVGQMLAQAALYSGYGGEQPKSTRRFAIVGRWQVLDARGLANIKPGDRVEFGTEGDLLLYRKGAAAGESEHVDVFEADDEIVDFGGYDQRWRYTLAGNRLSLDPVGRTPAGRVRLQRVD